MSVLIGPGLVITQNGFGDVVADGGVLVDGAEIAAVGPFAELRAAHPGAEVVDAGGMVIMPGLINAHAHFYGMYARGLSLKDPPPMTFQQVLERLWWRLDKALDAAGNYHSALLGGIAALRTGCTTVFDHHASPNAIDGSLDRVAEATGALGLRAVLCYEVTDRDGEERARAGIAENVRFGRRAAAGGDPLLRALLGLHASFTVDSATMAASVAAARELGLGCHIHCAEGPEDGAHARVHHGRKVVQRLLDAGVLGPHSILAHGVHIDEEEIGLLAETRTTVSHQPHSNMGNAVGWARILHMQERGVPVALGTDGFTWDMFESMKTAATLHSHQTRVPGDGVGQFAGVLFRNNAALATRLFGQPVGVLAAGALADVILVEYYPPTPLHGGNLPWHFTFGMQGAQVHSVMIGGRWAMRDHRVLGVDEAAAARAAMAAHQAIWERF